MDDERPIKELLNTIGNEQARKILAAIAHEPSSAKELTEQLNLSQATIYRRINKLQKHDLIKEQTLVADDGNHYNKYECNFNSVYISLEGSEYNVCVYREEKDLPDIRL